jgi:hypothetical protein
VQNTMRTQVNMFQCIWILNALLFLVIISIVLPFFALIWLLRAGGKWIDPKTEKDMKECDQYTFDHEEPLEH